MSPLMRAAASFAPVPAWAIPPEYPRRILIADIQAAVCRHYRLPAIEMRSARRAKSVARPRQVAMYLSKRLTPCSLNEVGRMFGGRDHTTVMWAIEATEARRKQDTALDADIRAIEAELLS